MSWKNWRRLRQGVQVLFFILFIYLLFAAVQRPVVSPLVDFFFRINPLSAAAGMLAAREWIPRLAPALIVIGLTVVLGRVWCGWLCPLGSLLEWLPLRSKRSSKSSPSPAGKRVKYFLLAATLSAALFGSLTLLVFEPLALLTRAMTAGVLPAFNYAVTTLEQGLYPVRFLRPAIDALESWARGPLLPVIQPAYGQNLTIIALLAGIVALNWLAPRFWCRSLCPLGGFLALLSRVSFLRPVTGAACNHCQRCVRTCQMDALQAQSEVRVDPAECTLCLDCLVECRPGDLRLSWVTPWQARRSSSPSPARLDAGAPPPALKASAAAVQTTITRRQALATFSLTAAGVALLQTNLRSKTRSPLLIRPPGAQDEDEFLARCVRCAQCIKVCPTTGLHPAFDQAGLRGVWTPVLIPRQGQCDYGCNACGQVCPSGAIPALSLSEKRQALMGLAAVDRNRCLPWSYDTPCIVCEEMCPLPGKAIYLDEVTVTLENGEQVQLQRPHVNSNLCTGCGICENHCPLTGEAGIRVHALGS